MTEYKEFQKIFEKLIEKDRLSHAYLFFGGNESDREAKFSFASSLANFLETGNFRYPEKNLQETLFVRSEPEEKKIGIDSVRNLKSFLFQTPAISRFRVAIIRDAEELTPEAQNAILKIVEEPPPSALLIFIARTEDNIYPTLASRLQKFYFPAAGKSKDKPSPHSVSFEETIENDSIDDFFESLFREWRKEPVKNFAKMKNALRRLTYVKQFNTNKRLQFRALDSLLKS